MNRLFVLVVLVFAIASVVMTIPSDTNAAGKPFEAIEQLIKETNNKLDATNVKLDQTNEGIQQVPQAVFVGSSGAKHWVSPYWRAGTLPLGQGANTFCTVLNANRSLPAVVTYNLYDHSGDLIADESINLAPSY